MNLQRSEGAVSSQLQTQRAREREAAGTHGRNQTLSSNHPLALDLTADLSKLRVPGGARGQGTSSQQEPSRSSICSGGRGGQDVVALPSNILQ